MKFQAKKNEVRGKQKWSSKQTKMKIHVNKNDVPSKQKHVLGKQKWSSKQTKMKFHLNKNEVISKQKRCSR